MFFDGLLSAIMGKSRICNWKLNVGVYPELAMISHEYPELYIYIHIQMFFSRISQVF